MTGLAFTADGAVLISAGWDGRLRLWDVGARRLVGDLEGHQWPVGSVQVVGRTMMSHARDGTRIWSLATSSPTRELAGSAVDIHDLAVSADGRFALSTIVNRSLWPGDPAGRAPEWVFGPTRRCLAFTTDGGHLWFQRTPGESLFVVADAEDEPVASPVRPGEQLAGCAFRSDGTLLTLASAGTVSAWDPHTGDLLWQVSSGSGPLRLDVGHDGRILVAGSAGEVRALGPDGSELWRYQPGEARASVARWDPRQSSVVVGDDAGRILVLSPEGVLRTLFHAHRGSINDVSFSPDGALLATAALINPTQDDDAEIADNTLTGDSGLRLWSTASWSRVADLFGHDATVLRVAFTADGASLVSGGVNGQALQWRGPAGWLAQSCAIAGRVLTDAERASLLTALSADPGC